MTDTLSYFVLGGLVLIAIIIVWGIVLLHSYPGKVAEERGHPQKDAIDATSVMGLLVFPFWMIALIWAYMRPVMKPVDLDQRQPRKPAPENDDDKPEQA